MVVVLIEFTSHYLPVHFLCTWTQSTPQVLYTIYQSSWPWSPNVAETCFVGELNKIWLRSTAVFLCTQLVYVAVNMWNAGWPPHSCALLLAARCVPLPPPGALSATSLEFRYQQHKHNLPGGKECNTLDLFSLIIRRSVHPNDVKLTSGGLLKSGGALFTVLVSPANGMCDNLGAGNEAHKLRTDK